MSPVEIIALVLIIFIVVKLVVVSTNLSAWKPVVNAVYAKPVVTMGVSIILGMVILNYLLQELTIVQIFASMAFLMTLMMLQFAVLGKEINEWADKFFNDPALIKKLWFPIALWIVLILWVLYEIFV